MAPDLDSVFVAPPTDCGVSAMLFNERIFKFG